MSRTLSGVFLVGASTGQEREKGQIGKIPEKKRGSPQRTEKDKSGLTHQSRETPPFETPASSVPKNRLILDSEPAIRCEQVGNSSAGAETNKKEEKATLEIPREGSPSFALNTNVREIVSA